MSWIPIEDKLPPRGLTVLLEASGSYTGPGTQLADHDFFIGSRLSPKGGHDQWLIYDNCGDDGHHLIYPKVHAWMPLPKHYELRENFSQDPDLMEHAMFEKDPEWLYKGDAVWEGQQMSIEEYLQQEVENELR